MKWDTQPASSDDQRKAVQAAQRCGLGAYLVTLEQKKGRRSPSLLVVAETHKQAAAVAINQHHERDGTWRPAKACNKLTSRKGRGR